MKRLHKRKLELLVELLFETGGFQENSDFLPVLDERVSGEVCKTYVLAKDKVTHCHFAV